MKINQLVLALAALSMLSMTQAYARDTYSVGINVRSYDYVAPMVSHYPNTIYYSRTPTVIYYGAPAVIQYVPIVRYGNNGGYGHYETEHYRQPERNYYREWNHGWRNNERGSGERNRYERHDNERNHGGHRHEGRD